RLQNWRSQGINRNYLISSTGLFLACAIGTAAAQPVGPAPGYRIYPEHTFNSPDGTTTNEQYAKIGADGSYTWQFWSRHHAKLTPLRPSNPTTRRASGSPMIRSGLCERKKRGPDMPACIYTALSPRVSLQRPPGRSVSWHGPTSRASPTPERSRSRIFISRRVS